MDEEGTTIRTLQWEDPTGGQDDVTLLQFADRFSRILYLTSLKFEEDDVSEEGDVCVILRSLSFAIAETVESFGPCPNGSIGKEEKKDV